MTTQVDFVIALCYNVGPSLYVHIYTSVDTNPILRMSLGEDYLPVWFYQPHRKFVFVPPVRLYRQPRHHVTYHLMWISVAICLCIIAIVSEAVSSQQREDA